MVLSKYYKTKKSFIADTLDCLHIPSDIGVWLMVLSLYLCGDGYLHIPPCDSTQIRSALFEYQNCLIQSRIVSNYYKTKTIIHCWHTWLTSYYIRQWGMTDASWIIVIWWWISTHSSMWQYQNPQYIFWVPKLPHSK